MVGVILDSHFFHFVCRTIFITSSMINVCSYAPSHTIDTFPFYYITFSCFVWTGTFSTDWGFTIIFIRVFACYVTNFLTVVTYYNMIRIIHSIQARSLPRVFYGGGGGRFSQNWTFSSINVIAYIGIYKMKCLKMLF